MTEEKNSKHYWRAYHYKNDPFAVDSHTPLFISEAWEEYLDLLPQFLRYCSSLVLLEGKTGVGKTTLIQEFIRKNNGDADIVLINAAECQGTEYLLELLHEKFSAPCDPQSVNTVNEQLDEQINYLKLNKSPRLLIIDDAEQLPLDMRQACLQITQQQNNLDTCLPIILVGTEALSAQYHALLTSKTAEKCLYFIYLAPFTENELADYLQFACEQVGEQAGQSPFNQEDIETLYKATDGIIAQIPGSARNLLNLKLHGQATPKQQIKKRVVWWVITLVVIIALLFVYKYLSRPPELTTTISTPIILRDNPSAENNAAKNNPVEKPTDTKQIGNLLVHTTDNTEKKPASATPVSKPVNVVAKATEKVHPHATKPETKKPVKPTLFDHVMAERLALQKHRVLAINGKKFTMQLLAAEDLHNVQKFINQHRLQTTAMIVPITRKNKTVYLVLYGMFDSKQQANKILHQTNPELIALHPWVRSYASIHDELKKA
jgi:septal ring-binding cell division protein DamX